MKTILSFIILSVPLALYAQQTETRASIPIDKMLSTDPDLPTESHGFHVGDTVYFLDIIYFYKPMITDRRSEFNLLEIAASWRDVMDDRVTVVAPAEGNGRFGRYAVAVGERCFPPFGSSIQVISFSPSGEFALMQTLAESGGGTGCPLLAKFILPSRQLPALRDEYQARLRAEEERDAIVRQILSSDPDLPPESNGFHVGQIVYSPDQQRIPLVNKVKTPYIDSSGIRPTGEYSLLGTPKFTTPRQPMLETGSACGIGDENRLEILGFSLDGEMALLENLSTHWDGNGPSPECTQGARFLISTAHLQQEFAEPGFFTLLWEGYLF